MLKTLKASELKDFRAALRGAFEQPGHETHVRTLTTPGGPIANAKLLWRPQPGIWAYFHPGVSGDNNRWLCWYGLNLGPPNRPLAPSIEINLAVAPDNKQAAGRALTGRTKAGVFLGHKGGLGGGRGGQMSQRTFDQHIRGFVREPIQLGSDREEGVFVIGNVRSQDFISRLRAYVAECERLRALARSQSRGGKASQPGGPGGGKFKPEFDVNGTGGGGPANPYEIDRVHARVVNALQKRLGAHAINSTRSQMRPDLYIKGPDGAMKVLFEVKGCASFQSWFTAIGQLLVYGAGERTAPRLVLVSPAAIQNPNFSIALKSLGISLVTFDERPNKEITFHGLEAVLGP